MTRDLSVQLDGATRVHLILGDPIEQVKSPAGMTDALQNAGMNAVLVPVHVTPASLASFVNGVSMAKNIDGIVMTVPHKFAAFHLCARTTERAAFSKAVNVMRRNADGSWHGDMCDGVGYVDAMLALGGDPSGKRVLLVGAGGAGSAIAHALVVNGARSLAIHDASIERRDVLVARLSALLQAEVSSGSPDPVGFDIVLNATPSGMREGDALPVDVSRLQPHMFVGDVITRPAVPPLLEAARAIGCRTQTGADMFAKTRDRMLAFLIGD